MNSRAKRTTWRIAAGLGGARPNLFRGADSGCSLFDEALLSRTRCVSNCQNRYPSPSRGSGQKFLTGPACSCASQRGTARFRRKTATVIAYQPGFRCLETRGSKPHHFRGNTRCKTNLNSYLSLPLLEFRPVAKARTWSAQPSEASQDAWLVISWTKEAVSKALFWVPVPGHCRTTSTFKKNRDGSDVSTTEFKGCPSMASGSLFVCQGTWA